MMVERNEHQQQGMEGKLQFHSRLTQMECSVASLTVCNLRFICRGLTVFFFLVLVTL